ncbi:MAG: hypothetical protein J0H26_09210, partial [Alphaproteobacteria bacterium]|nr:hypothetical protein [Alphaproteobacteria bacterium]
MKPEARSLRSRSALSQLTELARLLRLATATIKRDLRSSDVGQILACAIIGALTGGIVDFLRRIVELLHK